VAEAVLDDLRGRIDLIDRQLLELLNERMKVSIEVVRAKRTMGKAVFDATRELALLERLERLNAGPLSNEGLRRIYEAIIEESRIRQALSSDHKDSSAP